MALDIGFLLSITGLRGFFPNYFWYGPDAFWFISLILQLYILFPLLFWLILKTGNLIFLILTFTLCAFSRLMTNSLEENTYVFMLGLAPNRMAEFSLGMALGYNTAINQGVRLSFFSLNNRLCWITSFLSIMGAGFLYWEPSSPMRTIGLDLLLSIASFTALAILVLLLFKNDIVSKFLILIGSISYSFYLLHSPPIRPTFAALNTVGVKSSFLGTLLYLGLIALSAFVLSHLESWLFSLHRSTTKPGS
jgi:peptidoglycan/LPS O-acetylase OafA/YrhL